MDHLSGYICTREFNHVEFLFRLAMEPNCLIRKLVSKALYFRQLTPEIENQINCELTRLGYISDVDYEALELLMEEMDERRIQLVPTM